MSMRILTIVMVASLAAGTQLASAARNGAVTGIHGGIRSHHTSGVTASGQVRVKSSSKSSPTTPSDSHVVYSSPWGCQAIDTAHYIYEPLCGLAPEPMSAEASCATYGSNCTDQELCEYWSICAPGSGSQSLTPTPGLAADGSTEVTTP